MDKDKIRKQLNDIVAVHQRIITSLKAQTVRQNKLIEEYSEDVDEEMKIPSNKYMNWTRFIKPYQDAVISGKLVDFDLIKQYEKFLADIIKYESQYIIDETELENLGEGFDYLVDIILRLEKRIVDMEKMAKNEPARIIHSKVITPIEKEIDITGIPEPEVESEEGEELVELEDEPELEELESEGELEAEQPPEQEQEEPEQVETESEPVEEEQEPEPEVEEAKPEVPIARQLNLDSVKKADVKGPEISIRLSRIEKSILKELQTTPIMLSVAKIANKGISTNAGALHAARKLEEKGYVEIKKLTKGVFMNLIKNFKKGELR